MWGGFPIHQDALQGMQWQGNGFVAQITNSRSGMMDGREIFDSNR
jgi:hypothetical protein